MIIPKNAPKEMKDLLQDEYDKCMKIHNNVAMCSGKAWTKVKDTGWHKNTKTDTWEKKTKK